MDLNNAMISGGGVEKAEVAKKQVQTTESLDALAVGLSALTPVLDTLATVIQRLQECVVQLEDKLKPVTVKIIKSEPVIMPEAPVKVVVPDARKAFQKSGIQKVEPQKVASPKAEPQMAEPQKMLHKKENHGNPRLPKPRR